MKTERAPEKTEAERDTTKYQYFTVMDAKMFEPVLMRCPHPDMNGTALDRLFAINPHWKRNKE